MRKSASARRPAEGTTERESPTPRVCLLTETFFPVVGGGETHARLLASHLNSLGMVTFILTRRSDPKLARFESVKGIPTYRVPPARFGRFAKYAMIPFVVIELARKREMYEVILVCGFRVLGAPAVLAAKLLGKVCVLRAEAEGLAECRRVRPSPTRQSSPPPTRGRHQAYPPPRCRSAHNRHSR